MARTRANTELPPEIARDLQQEHEGSAGAQPFATGGGRRFPLAYAAVLPPAKIQSLGKPWITAHICAVGFGMGKQLTSTGK